MSLTRPTIQNINTNLAAFSDSLTVTNFGNVANRDIGEVFDRSQGGGSNVAIFWKESLGSFAFAYTSSTGKETGNLTVTQYADLIASNITANNLIVSNIVYQSSEYVSTTEVVAGNSTVNGLTVNTSATIGATLGIAGNLTATNILPSANITYDLGSPTRRFKSLYLSGQTIYLDTATISSNATAITFTNPAGGSFTIAGSDTFVASSAAETAQYVTGNAQANITSVGTLSGLNLSGTTTGTTFYGANFGNNGANFTGNVFSALALQTETLTVASNATLNGPVSISSIGNLSIPGGFSGYVLKTDGAGTLSWQGAGGITYTANASPPVAGNLAGDQWYNTSTDVIYEYAYDGFNSYWVDISGAAFSNVNSSNVSATQITTNYAPLSATGAAISVTAANTRGGTGYADFLSVTNASSGATDPNKYFRLTSSGGLEVINSAYSQSLLGLSNSGDLSVAGQYQVNGKTAVNGPAFSAYAAAILQTIPDSVQTKVLFQTEEFDTNSCYSSSRFTPNVEGYYQLNAEVRLDGSSGTGECMIILYKNGSEYKRGTNQSGTQFASNFWAMQVSSIAYANGTGDYFEIYVQQGSGASRTVTAVNNTAITWFNGCMVRGA